MINLITNNVLIYCIIIYFWLIKLYSIIKKYCNYLIFYDFINYDDIFINHLYHILIINVVLFILSFDSNIHYLIITSIYFINIVEFHIKHLIYEYEHTYDFNYIFIYIHLILISIFIFIFISIDDYSYVLQVIFIILYGFIPILCITFNSKISFFI